VPSFRGVLLVALDIAEVCEASVITEVSDRRQDVRPHGREVPLTERRAVVVAGVEIKDTIVVLDARDDAILTADGSSGWIVGMEGHPHARLLGNWDDPLEEALEILPEVSFVDGLVGDRRTALHPVVVIAGSDRVGPRRGPTRTSEAR